MTKIVNEESVMMVSAFQKAKLVGGSLWYAAPEVVLRFDPTSPPLRQTSIDWYAVDVFAFAVSLGEMCTRVKPYAHLNNKEESPKEIKERLLHEERPFDIQPLESLRRVRRLIPIIHASWHIDPNARPSMMQIWESLRNIK